MTLLPNPTSGALDSTSLGVITETYTRNEYGELASYVAKAGATILYSVKYDNDSQAARDGLGRVTRQIELPGSVVTDYQYDEQGRLHQLVATGQPSRVYDYDSNGNRLMQGLVGYDAQDRMTYNEMFCFTYTYGPNGERSKRTRCDGATDEYQYDALGNLSHITRQDGATIDYVVDALNRRIAKKKNGSTIARYIYRNGLSPVAVLDSTGALAARFVYASRPNTPDFMVLANGTVYKFISDQRGSARVIANAATGAVAQRVDYDEFGIPNMVVNSGAFPTWVQPFGFAGGLYDEDTGLVRFGARDYEAQTGRWLAKDPALFGGGQANLYVYAGNDPVNRIDPTGLIAPLVAAALASGAVGAIAGAGAYYMSTPAESRTWAGWAGHVGGGFVAGAGIPFVAAGLEIGGAVGGLFGFVGATGAGLTGDILKQATEGTGDVDLPRALGHGALNGIGSAAGAGWAYSNPAGVCLAPQAEAWIVGNATSKGSTYFYDGVTR